MPSWTDRQLPSTLLPLVGPCLFGFCTIQPGSAYQQRQLKQSFSNAMRTQNAPKVTNPCCNSRGLHYTWSEPRVCSNLGYVASHWQVAPDNLPIPSSMRHISSSPPHENQWSAGRWSFGSPEYISPPAQGKIRRDEHHSQRNTYLYQRRSFTCYSKGLF